MAVIRGTAASDTLRGTAAGDTLHAFGGSDRAFGGGGDDRAYGGAGIDRLYGGDAGDTLSGGNDTDYLFGGWGSDLLLAGAGNDRLYGDLAADRLYGGEGANLLYGGGAGDVLAGRDGADRLYGGDGNDRMLGEDGADLAWGGTGRDRLYGGGDGDRLHGNAGRDWLYGGEGNDQFRGGAGGDFLYGGAGNDRVDGGLNFDTAYYSGSSAGYVYVTSGAVTYIRDIDTTDGDDGRDVLTGVERLRFADATVALEDGTAVTGPRGLYLAGDTALWAWDGSALEPLTEGTGGGSAGGDSAADADPAGPVPGGGGPILGSHEGGLYAVLETRDAPEGAWFNALYRIDEVSGDMALVGGVDADGRPLVRDILDGTLLGDTLYLSAMGEGETAAQELYAVDLATQAVTLAAEVRPGEPSVPFGLLAADGDVFFWTDYIEGLQRYDPATGEVSAIGDFFSRHESSFVGHPRDDLAADADHVYFAPGSGGSGSGLYRYTLGGGAVERLADGLTGLSPSEVRGLTLFDDRLYFAATGDGGEAALHVWDPGPLRLTEVAGAPAPLDLLAAEDALYFVGQYGSTPADAALYALAPGGGSPVQVHDLAALGDVEGADLLQVLDGDLYLAIARSRTGAELYRFDPETGSLRAAGTTLPGAAGDLATTDSADAFVF